MARGMIVKEDAKRRVVNNSQSAYSYWAARYTYTVDGKEYRKRFSCDKRHSTRSELRTIINVYWLDDPNNFVAQKIRYTKYKVSGFLLFTF